MAGRRKMAATSRDPEEWAAATKAARETREAVAHEMAALLKTELPLLADVIAVQVAELIVVGDSMGGRGRIAKAIEQIVRAEQRQDPEADEEQREANAGVLRAAVVELVVAGGAWVAALDFVPPQADPEPVDEAA